MTAPSSAQRRLYGDTATFCATCEGAGCSACRYLGVVLDEPAANLPREGGNATVDPTVALVEWLRTQDWSDFARDLVRVWDRTGRLSSGQIGAAQRWFDKDAAKRAAFVAPVAAAPEAPRVDGLDLSTLPAGCYAVPGGETRLKVLVERPDDGKWADWIFVKDAAVYGQGQKYGSQRPGGTYRGRIEPELRAIVADPLEASKAYGRLVGRCGRCGRPLEVQESIDAGIGPVCATKAWVL